MAGFFTTILSIYILSTQNDIYFNPTLVVLIVGMTQPVPTRTFIPPGPSSHFRWNDALHERVLARSDCVAVVAGMAVTLTGIFLIFGTMTASVRLSDEKNACLRTRSNLSMLTPPGRLFAGYEPRHWELAAALPHLRAADVRNVPLALFGHVRPQDVPQPNQTTGANSASSAFRASYMLLDLHLPRSPLRLSRVLALRVFLAKILIDVGPCLQDLGHPPTDRR